jgi:hypothetical protein
MPTKIFGKEATESSMGGEIMREQATNFIFEVNKIIHTLENKSIYIFLIHKYITLI